MRYEKADNPEYYKDAHRKWRIAPRDKSGKQVYQDAYKYVDDNIRDQRYNVEYERRQKEKESPVTDKQRRQYNRARQMADNERDKLISQYTKHADTYTEAGKQKIKKAKIRNSVRKAVKTFTTNWTIGAKEMQSQVKKGSNFVKNLFK